MRKSGELDAESQSLGKHWQFCSLPPSAVDIQSYFCEEQRLRA